MNKYKVIGLMSGTSLDGLDMAYCEFVKDRVWKFRIVKAETVKYTKRWKEKLSSAFRASKEEIAKIDTEFGFFTAQQVRKFIRKQRLNPEFIASHGHTIYHEPEKGLTLQIGSGAVIASACGLPVVCDFRSGDVALGGQGAPLVPVADMHLFGDYDLCLNLGGIANVSYDRNSERIAFDICPANMALNMLAGRLGREFDHGGKLAARGKVNPDLLDSLNGLAFYKSGPPKSLGREWVEEIFFPLLDRFNISEPDKLRTVSEHIAYQVSLVVRKAFPRRKASLLITGGGAYNSFLVRRISALSGCRVAVPSHRIIQFKEAMAFAFLAVLKMRGEINILKCVTGARKDSSGGRIYPAG